VASQATFTPASSSWLSVPSLLISLLFSTERGILPVRPRLALAPARPPVLGLRLPGVPPVGHYRPPVVPHADTLGSSLAALLQQLHCELFTPSDSEFPRKFFRFSGRFCMCILLSVLLILLFVLQHVACQTKSLARHWPGLRRAGWIVQLWKEQLRSF
jgi:hypothetical protein